MIKKLYTMLILFLIGSINVYAELNIKKGGYNDKYFVTLDSLDKTKSKTYCNHISNNSFRKDLTNLFNKNCKLVKDPLFEKYGKGIARKNEGKIYHYQCTNLKTKNWYITEIGQPYNKVKQCDKLNSAVYKTMNNVVQLEEKEQKADFTRDAIYNGFLSFNSFDKLKVVNDAYCIPFTKDLKNTFDKSCRINSKKRSDLINFIELNRIQKPYQIRAVYDCIDNNQKITVYNTSVQYIKNDTFDDLFIKCDKANIDILSEIKIAKERLETQKIAKEKAEAERVEKEKAEAERIAKEKAEAEKIAKEFKKSWSEKFDENIVHQICAKYGSYLNTYTKKSCAYVGDYKSAQTEIDEYITYVNEQKIAVLKKKKDQLLNNTQYPNTLKNISKPLDLDLNFTEVRKWVKDGEKIYKNERQKLTINNIGISHYKSYDKEVFFDARKIMNYQINNIPKNSLIDYGPMSRHLNQIMITDSFQLKIWVEKGSMIIKEQNIDWIVVNFNDKRTLNRVITKIKELNPNLK